MLIKWKDEYSTGVEHIDEQHKELFRISQEIFNLYNNEFCVDKYDRIVELIEELKKYTVFHFNTEEEYMASINYKKLLSHKVDHADFIEKVSNVDLTSIDKDHDAYLLDILKFVVDWIVNHILEKDKLITQ